MRYHTPSLTAKLNAEQEAVIKKAKEDQAACCITKVKTRTLKSVERLVDDGVFLQTQSCNNLLMCYLLFAIPLHAARRAMAAAEPLPKQRRWAFLHIHFSLAADQQNRS